MSRVLLALESSCDETAAAIIDEQRTILSNVVATQTELHERFGGVVPEIASRAHLECLLPVIDQALRDAGKTLQDLSGIVVATEPGLVGSLLVSLTAAKTLSLVLQIPLIAINHVEAHLYACQLGVPDSIFPAIGLVVSGGHTNLYDCRSPVEFELLGSTIDDAAGEAFDKVAQILDLGFPGGPALEKLAEAGDPTAFAFPRSFLQTKTLEFSFSGLKTAVLYATRGLPGTTNPPPELTPERKANLAASFQAAVIDVLVAKCDLALRQQNRRRLLVGGGVAANGPFRHALDQLARRRKVEILVAPRVYCTDNAAMGALGWERFERNLFAPLDVDVTPGLVRKRERGSAPSK